MLATLAVGPALRAGAEHHPVRFVVDGDTIDVSHLGRVRLLGIDAPEIGLGFDTPAAFAQEARALLTTLVGARYVSLETDGDLFDKYGRRLAYVLRDDGLLVNAEMLRAGLARVSARRQLRRLSELRAAERAAKVARRGMWGARPVLPLERSIGLRRREVPQGRKPLEHPLFGPPLQVRDLAPDALLDERCCIDTGTRSLQRTRHRGGDFDPSPAAREPGQRLPGQQGQGLRQRQRALYVQRLRRKHEGPGPSHLHVPR